MLNLVKSLQARKVKMLLVAKLKIHHQEQWSMNQKLELKKMQLVVTAKFRRALNLRVHLAQNLKIQLLNLKNRMGLKFRMILKVLRFPNHKTNQPIQKMVQNWPMKQRPLMLTLQTPVTNYLNAFKSVLQKNLAQHWTLLETFEVPCWLKTTQMLISKKTNASKR
jgi:hypothetical protein